MKAVYSALKVFRFPEHLAAPSDSRMLRTPIHVRIKPVNACNQRCWYCAYREDALSLGDEMDLHDRIPPEKMAEIVEDLIAMGVRAVTFSGGGEPLIYRYLPETIRSLAAGGIRVASLTNGWALRGDVAQALAQHATWIRISIDAWDGPSYARSRGVPQDAFEQVMRNAETFVRLTPQCVLGFSFIVTQQNAAHIAEFCERAKQIGATHVKLSACIVGNEASENDAYHASIAEIAAEQIRRAQALSDGYFSVVDHYHALSGRFERPYTTCPMLEYLTVIGADCAVYTCQDKAYTESGYLGSIRDRRFREMWSSPETEKRVRELNPQIECMHHCTANAKNVLLTEYRGLDEAHAAFV